MFWQAKHSHTSFAKRGTMQHFFPLRPAEFEAGHHMHMLSLRPDRILKTGRYMHISSPTPRLDLGRGTTCKIYQLRPDAV